MPIDPRWWLLLVLSILIWLSWAWHRRQHPQSGPVGARTIGLLMRRCMRWSATAHTDDASLFRRCAAKRVEPPSAPGAGTLWVTPLYRLKTASQRVAEVLTALALGSLSPLRCVCSAIATRPSPPG